MHPYVRSLRAMLTRHANPQAAGPMKRYMRDQFEYLGIKSPQLGELLRAHTAAHGPPPMDHLKAIVLELWSLPEREFQYAATSLLEKQKDRLPADFISSLEHLLITKSWWDTVDSLATHIIAEHFKRHPGVRKRCLAKWRKSDNLWLRRTAILFQLNYMAETDFDLLCAIIRENLGSQEFFINKAIGWALRQYTRIDSQAVRMFVRETPLHPLSAREALKWLEKKKTHVS